MITRVASSTINSSLSSLINKSYSNYAKTTAQLGSGNKINSILDDSTGAINIIGSNAELSKITTYLDNVASATNQIKEASDTLDSADTKAQRAYDLATNAATGTSTVTTLTASKTELNQIIKGMVDLANTNYNNNYIFGGTNTTTSPYAVQYASDGTTITGITYNGTASSGDWERQLEVSDGVYQTVNAPGDQVFGEYGETYTYDSNGDGTAEATYTLDKNPDTTEQTAIATATGSAYDSSKTYYKGSDGTYIEGAPASGTATIYKSTGGVDSTPDSSKFTASASGIMGTLMKFSKALDTTIDGLNNTTSYTYDADGNTSTANVTYDLDSSPSVAEQGNISAATGSAYDATKTYYKGSDGSYVVGPIPSTGTFDIYSGGGVSSSPKVTTFTGSSTAGYKSINGLLNEFQSSLATITNTNSNFGTISNKMDLTKTSLTDTQTNLKDYVSGIQETDVTQIMSQWYSEQSAFQASMKAATSIMSMSLLDYM